MKKLPRAVLLILSFWKPKKMQVKHILVSRKKRMCSWDEKLRSDSSKSADYTPFQVLNSDYGGFSTVSCHHTTVSCLSVWMFAETRCDSLVSYICWACVSRYLLVCSFNNRQGCARKCSVGNEGQLQPAWGKRQPVWSHWLHWASQGKSCSPSRTVSS